MSKHTPYDGSATPFTIGLRQLDLATWIERDETFEAQLAEKRRLYAAIPADVFVAEPDTETAQQEVLDLLRTHLTDYFPNAVTDIDPALAPLHAASLLVQEDLILMRRGTDGWRLAAGSLCFPSSWTLVEKFGHPLEVIHQPVPGFGPGTRNADLILRMFDNLSPGRSVERYNWSVQAGGALYHPLSHKGREDRSDQRVERFRAGDVNANAFVRVERQTLRKLPKSGDILFTVRIYLDPVGWMSRQPNATAIASGFARQLMALDRDQLDYKGLTADRDVLVGALDKIAAEANS